MNKKLILNKNYILLAFITIVIFFWFYQISKLSPLAGDDWAFHNNVMSSGIIDSAFGMYRGWEGRLMTLFSIHYFIVNRSVWEIFNGLMYALIFLLGTAIVKPKKPLLYALSYLVVIFTIKDNLRMEVFTWTTGSIYYGLPLLISVIYFSIQYSVLQNIQIKKPWYYWLFALGSAFYLPLGMENIAIASIGLNLFMIISIWIKKQKIDAFQIAIFVSFVIAYIIWALSPGSSIRLSQMPEWQSLSLMGKITQTLPDVLYFTFFENKYLILFLSAALVFYNMQKGSGRFKWLYNVVLLLAIPMTFMQRLALLIPHVAFIQLLADGYSIVSLIFWFVYALVLILNIIQIDYQSANLSLSPILLVAVLSSASLLLSPVIGYRLMVYSVFYLMFLTLIIIDKVELNKIIRMAMYFMIILLILFNANKIYRKYQIVYQITQERIAIIADYRIYHDQYENGIWLPRYPIYSIHGGDIEVDNTYHMKAFKTYFGLPPDEKLIFYWKDSY